MGIIIFTDTLCMPSMQGHCVKTLILTMHIRHIFFDNRKWLTIALQVVKLAEHYIKFNIVYSFLLDPIHLEEVVREQIAGVEDHECASAFVKFCTHLSLLLFAAVVWWL